MSALFVVVLMILVAGLPVGLGCWYFHAKHAVPMRLFWAAMLAGAFAVLLAAGAQLLVAPLSPQPNLRTGVKWPVLYTIFIEIAATEELARVLMLTLSVSLFKNTLKNTPHKTALVRTMGMILGFTFAAVETVFFTMTSIDSGFVRAFSAVPLHGACGIRAGNAALYRKHSPGLSLLSLFFAIMLHGIYNFLVQRGGLFPYLGIALVITAFISGAQTIRFEENDPPNGQ
jgi:hypothetical protein